VGVACGLKLRVGGTKGPDAEKATWENASSMSVIRPFNGWPIYVKFVKFRSLLWMSLIPVIKF